MKITLEYGDDEVDRFKRVLFADEAWSAINQARDLVRNQIKHGESAGDQQALKTVQDVLNDVLWRVE